jgi:hypothetical protein
VNKADCKAAIEVQSVTNEHGSPVENFMCQHGKVGSSMSRINPKFIGKMADASQGKAYGLGGCNKDEDCGLDLGDARDPFCQCSLLGTGSGHSRSES